MFVFFFKQKTAYEMRISDWSSDVCSSDLYVSSWLKCHHPAVFACGILNSQPMGFYAPAQLVRDAREHGIEVRGVDVNASGWDNSLERKDDGSLALRLGFRQVDGFRAEWAARIAEAGTTPFASVAALARRPHPPSRALVLPPRAATS